MGKIIIASHIRIIVHNGCHRNNHCKVNWRFYMVNISSGIVCIEKSCFQILKTK